MAAVPCSRSAPPQETFHSAARAGEYQGIYMRMSIFITVIMLPLLAAAADGRAYAFSASDAYGFSSEDFGGGSYLGVDTRDITPDRLGALHLKEEHGVEVT